MWFVISLKFFLYNYNCIWFTYLTKTEQCSIKIENFARSEKIKNKSIKLPIFTKYFLCKMANSNIVDSFYTSIFSF